MEHSDYLDQLISSDCFDVWFEASLAKYPHWFPFLQKCADEGQVHLLWDNFDFFCVDLFVDLANIIKNNCDFFSGRSSLNHTVEENKRLMDAVRSRFHHVAGPCLETAETNASVLSAPARNLRSNNRNKTNRSRDPASL